MTTIPLCEALKRAHKGPVIAGHNKKSGVAWVDITYGDTFKVREATENDAADAALLSHCRNELPELVESMKDLMTQRVWDCYCIQLSSEHQPCHTCRSRKGIEAAPIRPEREDAMKLSRQIANLRLQTQ